MGEAHRGWKKSGLTQPRYCERVVDPLRYVQALAATPGDETGFARGGAGLRAGTRCAGERTTRDAGGTGGDVRPSVRGPRRGDPAGERLGDSLRAELDEVALGRRIRLLEVLPC